MSTLLYYNNNLILSGQPTPFVGREETAIKYGERWGNKTTLTLHGQITGCTFPELTAAQRSLLNIFVVDFQNFKIVDEGITIFDKPYVLVRDVSFPSNAYNNILNYQVTLDYYDENLFSGFYGVVDPIDQWSFEEQVDGFVNATHTISARGFNTSSGASNAFDNAKDFVLSRTGFSPIASPYFINTGVSGNFSPCLKALQERPNRFDGSYSVTETYVADLFFGLDGALRYSVDFSCPTDGKARVTVQGTIDGCGMAISTEAIRNRYSTIDTYALAAEVYSGSVGQTGLNPYYVSRGYNEDPYSRRLTFNIVYDNTTGTNTFLDYSVGLESGENGITTVKFDANIKGRGDLAARWPRVLELYSGLVPIDYAAPAYLAFAGGAPWPLNTKEITKSITFNSFQGEIDLSYAWDNKTYPWPGFADVSWSLNFTPPLHKYIATQLLNDCGVEYYLADAGYANKGVFSFEGRGRLDCDLPNAKDVAIFTARNSGNQAFLTNTPALNPVLQVNDLQVTPSEVGFKFEWTYDGPEFDVNSPF